MITLTREEAQQVLDALGFWDRGVDEEAIHNCVTAIETLRARLAQPEPEPTKLLLIPALMEQAGWVRKREWQGLTEIEICDIEADELTSASSETFSFARAIEAKLKEKNG